MITQKNITRKKAGKHITCKQLKKQIHGVNHCKIKHKKQTKKYNQTIKQLNITRTHNKTTCTQSIFLILFWTNAIFA